MQAWQVGLVVLMAIGVAVITWGFLHDRERLRRYRRALASVPDRPVPGLAPEEAPPAYLAADDALRTPADAAGTDLDETDRAALRTALRDHQPLPARRISTAFVTDDPTGWSVLEEPLVLVCTEPVETVRELLPALRYAAAGRSLLLIAPAYAPQVRATLEANVRQRLLRLSAHTTAYADLPRITAAAGGEAVSRSDLQAGYLPPEVLGGGSRAVADDSQLWLLPGRTP